MNYKSTRDIKRVQLHYSMALSDFRQFSCSPQVKICVCLYACAAQSDAGDSGLSGGNLVDDSGWGSYDMSELATGSQQPWSSTHLKTTSWQIEIWSCTISDGWSTCLNGLNFALKLINEGLLKPWVELTQEWVTIAMAKLNIYLSAWPQAASQKLMCQGKWFNHSWEP